jgi:transposase
MRKAYQTDLSDAEWSCLELHLPVPKADGRPRLHHLREMLFALLSASGTLLAPVLGHTARVANYLHEFAHDGRHLLAVPCH